jgi:hypothetical protein
VALVAGMACVLLGCAGHRPAATGATEIPESSAATPPPRRPDGVVIDPPPLRPTPALRSPAQGVVSLREPAGEDAIVDLVRAFLDAWQRESLETLLALTAPDAGLLEDPEHGHAALVESWRQRLHAHDYGRIATAEMVRPERIERWEWDELGTPATPSRPPTMRPGELLVRAPLEVTRVAGERVFGDVVVMVVRRQEGRLRIAAYGEVDAP